jgi:hypothetical protein
MRLGRSELHTNTFFSVVQCEAVHFLFCVNVTPCSDSMKQHEAIRSFP